MLRAGAMCSCCASLARTALRSQCAVTGLARFWGNRQPRDRVRRLTLQLSNLPPTGACSTDAEGCTCRQARDGNDLAPVRH